MFGKIGFGPAPGHRWATARERIDELRAKAAEGSEQAKVELTLMYELATHSEVWAREVLKHLAPLRGIVAADEAMRIANHQLQWSGRPINDSESQMITGSPPNIDKGNP